MAWTSRGLVAVGLGLVVLAGWLIFHPGGLWHLLLQVPGDCQTYDRAVQSYLAMEERGQALKRRILAKQEVINALRNGQLDLFQAAAWFAPHNRNPGGEPDRTEGFYPG